MSFEGYWSGTVKLKESVTFSQVMDLYREHCDDEEPELQLSLEIEGTFRTEFGEVELTVKDGELDYHASGDFYGNFDFDAFLHAVQQLATEGWLSWEGSDDQQAYFYGPTVRSKLEKEAEFLRGEIKDHQDKLARIEKELARHG